MTIYKTTTITQEIPYALNCSREQRLIVADSITRSAVDFLNEAFESLHLKLPHLQKEYNPQHESKWLCFFLRETIRNSVDAYFDELKNGFNNIAVKITLKTDDSSNLYLKIKDNGPGFNDMLKGCSVKAVPAPSEKDKRNSLGGKGFGLSICGEKLPDLLFKNRKDTGASVQCLLGNKAIISS